MRPAKGTLERYFGNEERGQLPANQFDALLKEVDLEVVKRQARWRIVHVFAGARSGPDKTSTPGYIAGRSEKLSDLVSYIKEHMSPAARNEIFSQDNLPEDYQRHFKGTLIEAVERVVQELLMLVLVEMRAQHCIYRLDGDWEILASQLDEYRVLTAQMTSNPPGRSDRPRGSRKRRSPHLLPVTVRRELLATG